MMWRCICILVVFLGPGSAQTCTGLTGLNIDPNSVSVSGISAGGAMAQQYHVAYSADVIGVGVFAASGPYYCAESSLTFALGRCMTAPENIPTSDLIAATSALSAEGRIDDPSNMAGDNVYIFHGSVDDVVAFDTWQSIAEYYTAFGANIVSETTYAAGHGQPTVEQGNLCSTGEDPYVNRCNYDGAYEALNHIYSSVNGGELVRPERPVIIGDLPGELRSFDQNQFVDGLGGAGSISMDETGYMYVPSGCVDGANVCRIHLALHGCLQNYGVINDAYIMQSGYNEVGELNNIVIVYPQTIRSFTIPYNPNGCFDWWGYNDPALNEIYHTQEGDQMIMLKDIVDCVIGG